MSKNKGFTLVELMAGIIVISAILTLIFMTFTKTLANSKEKAYVTQINSLKNTAQKWAVENTDLLSKDTPYYLSFNSLITSGHLKDMDIIDPRDKTTIPGCIKIFFDKAYDQYDYAYSPNCSG